MRGRVSVWAAAAAVATVMTASGCELRSGGRPELEVQTFQLEHLTQSEASELISPYVYFDREGAEGAVAAINGAISVRETRDNLDRIGAILEEYDRPEPDIRLHFQLIEADGYSGSDPQIRAVEDELRKLFQFRGYRLAGEAFVTASDGSSFGQGLQAADDLYRLEGNVYHASAGVMRLQSVHLWSTTTGEGIETTINIRPGQTLVLGSSPKTKTGSRVTLLLTVRAEEASGPA